MNQEKTKIFINPFGDSFYCHKSDKEEDSQQSVEKLYLNICNYFKRRGFDVVRDEEAFNNYPTISKGYKYGIKNGLEFNSKPTSAGFTFEFYQNINFENKNGGKYDFNKYEKMPYRIKLTYRNEMFKLADFLKTKNVEVIIKYPLSDIEKIIKSNQDNTHIHGQNIKCLEDIGVYMASESGRHNRENNSKDANKKQITCGETKYFYDYYNKKLSRGIVYHHINNMWWVLVNGKSYNISSFDLFDLTPETPFKKPISLESKINRMERELKKLEEKREYIKCINLNKSINKLILNQKKYRVWSIKHNAFWRADNNGYTQNKSLAGIYLEENIISNQSYYNDGVDNKAILIK